MRAYDVQIAVDISPGQNSTLDEALNLVVPVLEHLASRASKWKPWLGWGMRALIAAVTAYLESRDPTRGIGASP